MKARDRLRISVLRTTLSAIANAEAVPLPTPTRYIEPARGRSTDVQRAFLSEDDIRSIVRREHDQLVVDAQEFYRLGETARAVDLEAQTEILQSYLRRSSA